MLFCIEYGILFVDNIDTKIKVCNALTHPHIPAHNFLNVQQIFNPQKVLES